MNSSEYVCEVSKENSPGKYRLHTCWSGNGFQIKILTKDASWKGEMNIENMKTMSEQLGISESQYVKDCKDALTTNQGLADVSYQVENGQFVWKKLVDADAGIKMKLGAFKIQPSNFVEDVDQFLSVSLLKNQNLQKKLLESNQENSTFKNANLELLKKFDELISKKEEMETDLYSQFLSILNTKKERILYLEKYQEDKKFNKIQENTSKTISKIIEKRNNKSKKVYKKFEEDVYNIDTEEDSEEEMKSKNDKVTRSSKRIFETSKKLKPTEPSTSTLSKKKKIEDDSDATISDESLNTFAFTLEEQENIQNSAVQSKLLKQTDTALDLTMPDDGFSQSLLTNQESSLPSNGNDGTKNQSPIKSKTDTILDKFF